MNRFPLEQELVEGITVSVLVELDGRLLLVCGEDGWAPPTGNGPGRDEALGALSQFLDAAGVRVGPGRLVQLELRRLVYEATATTDGIAGRDSCWRWWGPGELAGIAEWSRQYGAGQITDVSWRLTPGLAPRWLQPLTGLGWIGGGR